MTTLRIETDNLLSNPLDLVEQVIIDRDWAYDRPSDEELVAEVMSSWCNYRMWFTWSADQSALIFSCAFETKLPKNARAKIYPLLAMVNEKLWVGHFDLVTEDNSVVFRHTMLLRGGSIASSEQVEDLVDIAVQECERFFPAFQSLIWGNRTPEESMQIAIFETVGEA